MLNKKESLIQYTDVLPDIVFKTTKFSVKKGMEIFEKLTGELSTGESEVLVSQYAECNESTSEGGEILAELFAIIKEIDLPKTYRIAELILEGTVLLSSESSDKVEREITDEVLKDLVRTKTLIVALLVDVFSFQYGTYLRSLRTYLEAKNERDKEFEAIVRPRETPTTSTTTSMDIYNKEMRGLIHDVLTTDAAWDFNIVYLSLIANRVVLPYELDNGTYILDDLTLLLEANEYITYKGINND